MKLFNKMLAWIESHGAVPAYGGWVLLGLMMCFWLAAANTMAGWLYVLSGLGVALLLLSALLPMQMLRGLTIERAAIYPIHAGELLLLTLTLRNPTEQHKGLLLMQDQVPAALGDATQTAVEAIGPQAEYIWHFRLMPQHRGIYEWKSVALRTGAPLGLFWSRRLRSAPGRAVVYPRILPLQRCPLMDEVGASRQQQLQQIPISQQGQEGATRSLRPYRAGDPRRLVHWRSSARYGELRVRELERFSSGYTLVIALDLTPNWSVDQFEQAVIAATSLLRYAERRYGTAYFWTAQMGLLQDRSVILETLAQIQPQSTGSYRLTQPAIWLTATAQRIRALPSGSRYLLWSQASTEQEHSVSSRSEHFGIMMNSDPLQVQLQRSVQAFANS